jgi:hypothetical protein
MNYPVIRETHRHLSNIDCLTAHTAWLICFISTVNGHSKKRSRMTGTSGRHITSLKKSILETFNIYGQTLTFRARQGAVFTILHFLHNLLINQPKLRKWLQLLLVNDYNDYNLSQKLIEKDYLLWFKELKAWNISQR